MSKTIYIANLPADANEAKLKSLFAEFGDILSIKLISDKDNGESLGYGFIEMDDEPAEEAIFAMNGKEFEGQSLQVNQARGRTSDR